MIRFKYVPDDWVYINDEYQARFARFVEDCAELNLPNPLTEGEYMLYTPPRTPLDRNRGVEVINSEGSHLEGDNKSNEVMDKIISMVGSFCLCQKRNLEKEKKIEFDAMTVEDRRKSAYLNKWSIPSQLEAMQDKIDGNSQKYDKMKSDFSKIKQDIQ